MVLPRSVEALREMVLRIVVNKRMNLLNERKRNPSIIIMNALELCRAVRGITGLLLRCRINESGSD